MTKTAMSAEPLVPPVLTAFVVISLTTAIIYALLKFRNAKRPALDPVVFKHLALVKKESVSHDTRRFTFALPDGPGSLLGLPVGQHITLKYTEMLSDVTTKDHQRSYTPITGDDTPGTVTFVIKVYRRGVHPKFPEGGKMSQHLDSLKIGDTMRMRGPKGECAVCAAGAKAREKISFSSPDAPFFFQLSAGMFLARGVATPFGIVCFVRDHRRSKKNVGKKNWMERRKRDDEIMQHDEIISMQSHDGHLRFVVPIPP
jgi:hypothetical protein